LQIKSILLGHKLYTLFRKMHVTYMPLKFLVRYQFSHS
jgi:hypothetical protein